jgi:hypothetical protein
MGVSRADFTPGLSLDKPFSQQLVADDPGALARRMPRRQQC